MGMHEFSTEYHPAGQWELFCDGQCIPRNNGADVIVQYLVLKL